MSDRGPTPDDPPAPLSPRGAQHLVVRSYNERYVKLWAPNSQTPGAAFQGSVANVGPGWGGESTQTREPSAEVRVEAYCGTAPDYDSGWISAKSQISAGGESGPDTAFLEVAHGLDADSDDMSRAHVQVVSRGSDGYWFEGIGSQQADDDAGPYGGIIYGYDEHNVRVWLPTNNDA